MCKGCTRLQFSTMLICASDKSTTLASSSSSLTKLFETKACSNLFDDWSFSCVLATISWMILTEKQSSIDSWYFTALKMLNTTYSSLTFDNQFSSSHIYQGSSNCKEMIAHYKWYFFLFHMSNTTKSFRNMNLSTFSRIF